MDPNASDEEQLEAITQWLKTNGTAIITGVAIGIAAILGWQYWNSQQAAQAEAASLQFDALQQAIATQDLDSAQRQGAALIDDYDDSLYATLAALLLAKLAVEQGNHATAAEHLHWVLDTTDQTEIKDIARLRLVRILLTEQRYDEAAAQLDQVTTSSLTAEREELRGDLHLAQGKTDQARSAYQAARVAQDDSALAALLDLKLNNLPALAN